MGSCFYILNWVIGYGINRGNYLSRGAIMNRWPEPLLIFLCVILIIVLILSAPAFLKSALHGFGWGLGREAAHSVFHHIRF